MENFEFKVLSIRPPLHLWKRYVDVTFVEIESADKNEFLDNIKSVDQCIHFTVEDKMADGSMPFLNTLVMTQPDGTLSTHSV